jgi:alanine racemase
MNERGLRTWIEVSRKAIESNIAELRKGMKRGVKFMAVVKSNAYGHGLTDFSKLAEQSDVDFFGVDSIVEGLALRSAGINKPILVLGYTMPVNFTSAVESNISITISSKEQLHSLSVGKIQVIPKIHIKVDTGMHRQGFQINEIDETLEFVLTLVNEGKIILEGLFTHFAAAKNPSFPNFTKRQLAEFDEWVTKFKKAGLKPICHAAATGGYMVFPESQYDMVRIGIGLYGLWPSIEAREYAKEKFALRPALTWKTLISEIKEVKKGEKVGYDCTETLERDSVLAICPIGYWHSYPRALSSIGKVIIRGRAARVVGRVSMDMICIDVTQIEDLKVGDHVDVMGGDSKAVNSIENVSSVLEASWYETITRINPLIKRIYID